VCRLRGGALRAGVGQHAVRGLQPGAVQVRRGRRGMRSVRNVPIGAAACRLRSGFRWCVRHMRQWAVLVAWRVRGLCRVPHWALPPQLRGVGPRLLPGMRRGAVQGDGGRLVHALRGMRGGAAPNADGAAGVREHWVADTVAHAVADAVAHAGAHSVTHAGPDTGTNAAPCHFRAGADGCADARDDGVADAGPYPCLQSGCVPRSGWPLRRLRRGAVRWRRQRRGVREVPCGAVPGRGGQGGLSALRGRPLRAGVGQRRVRAVQPRAVQGGCGRRRVRRLQRRVRGGTTEGRLRSRLRGRVQRVRER
jgi:hypothetical protein